MRIKPHQTDGGALEYGACSDDLCRLAALACGGGDRELSEADDWYFTAPSRRSYFMQGVVFAGVMADAAMVDSAIALEHTDRGRGVECACVLSGSCVALASLCLVGSLCVLVLVVCRCAVVVVVSRCPSCVRG